MDQCTHEVRAEYWKKIIQSCGQRPAGQSAKSCGYTGALKAPVRCSGNHLSGYREALFQM